VIFSLFHKLQNSEECASVRAPVFATSKVENVNVGKENTNGRVRGALPDRAPPHGHTALRSIAVLGPTRRHQHTASATAVQRLKYDAWAGQSDAHDRHADSLGNGIRVVGSRLPAAHRDACPPRRPRRDVLVACTEVCRRASDT
jgi:hypothetical protein